MQKRIYKRIAAAVMTAAMVVTLVPQVAKETTASAQATAETSADAKARGTYEQRFMDLWADIKDPANGYFSSKGVPYHSIETLIVEAPDYGHVTTSEALSYYMWLEAMYGKFTGDFSGYQTAWNVTEKYLIPTDADQPPTSMSKYNPSKPATYAPEYQDPSQYPAVLDPNAPVGKDPIWTELVAAYGRNTIYGMHWLLDVDNWYGYGSRGDGTTSPSYINTFQRGEEESTWETIPQPCWDDMKYGGKNGYLDLFTGDSTYSKQFKYTNAPDADARAVQAAYWANEWSKDYGVNIDTYLSKATMMGDYLRYSMFDKYFRKIGNSSAAGTGYDSAHYLLSWYYAWGGGTTADWAWIIGSSHNHFGYQNPMAAWILSENAKFKPKSTNGQSDWATSLDRQLEFYQWLQSSEGAIAGGASNSRNGRYEAWPAGTSTFYGMGYEENPVYKDPGSNTWFGFQAWSMQRVAEYYYKTNDVRAKQILDKWVTWIKSVVILRADGTFAIPNKIDWDGQPDTWTGTYTGNPGLHVTVIDYGTDLGVTGSLANTLLYYSKAANDVAAKNLAKELLDRVWNLYRDDKGVAAPELRTDYKRFFEQVIYVPSTFSGKMPNGDVIKSGVKFLDIRSKYLQDPSYQKLLAAYQNNKTPEFTYHRFWAQCDVAIAIGVYSLLYESGSGTVDYANITPTQGSFDKATGKQTDLSTTLSMQGYTFVNLSKGTTPLTLNTDYTVNGNTVVLKKEFLSTLPLGDTTITFNFSSGYTKPFIVTVVDTTVVVVVGDVKIQMYNGNTSATTNGIAPRFKLVNTGSNSINLSDVKIRYYYTIDGEKSQNFWCDWSSIGSGNVTGTFVKMATPKTGADYYLEIGFTSGAGSLQAGQGIEVQGRFSKTDWSNYTQTGDFSFNSSGNSYADWNKSPAYVSGKLTWGMEP
ncbi:glycoside hydrolase family 48 protein [Lachnoclostridium phytofermentans]|uniref:glycoside hydrolase family 48 protein n=1 Tax=Lachnoclostridium phytofermentans TaxID=66219 RepID=UPI0004958032|nr:glycoside hydrolase family 48 protein [Lachnoclostridium phytofermentans]